MNNLNDFLGQTGKEVKTGPGPKFGIQRKKKIRDTLRQGEKSEIDFAHKALSEHNLVVSTPAVTTDYDLVLENSAGILKKIQVKSSQKGDGNVNICKGTSSGGGSGKYVYPEDAIDYFAVHDIVHDTWYMIPRSVTGDKMSLRIALKSKGIYTKYKEDWTFV